MRYIIRRLLTALATIWVVSLLVFFLFRVLPGDPAVSMLGVEADPAALHQLRMSMGLDKPLVVQYLVWAGAAIRGDLGQSLRLSMPVAQVVREAFPVTASLAGLAMLLTLIMSLPLGLAAGFRRGSPLDTAIGVLSQLGLTVPYFWLGILLMLLFSLKLGWLPPGGFVPWSEAPLQSLRCLVLPAMALAVQRTAILTGLLRNSVGTEVRSDYVRTAVGKGLSRRRVAYSHVLRNALLPVLTVGGLQLAELLAGSVVAEQVFSLPGFGQFLVTGVGGRDFPMVQGLVLVLAASVVLVNLAIDLAYLAADPRIRYE